MIDINLKKRFSNFNIDVSFSFKQLRNVLFGVSGSGKSSILKMIAGFFAPDSGYIKVGNKVFFDRDGKINLPIFKRGVGYIPQEYTLFPHMTVEENILYGVRVRGLNLDRVRFNFLVEKAGLKGHLDLYPNELSGGQRQRASLVRSIIVSPNILLLDEPFTALDSSIRVEMYELLTSIVDNLEIPTIYVSHNLEEVYEFAQEIAVIDNGVVLKCSDRDTVFSNPVNPKMARLLGYKNVLKVDRVVGNRVFIDEHIIKVEKPVPQADFLFIRAEDVLLLRRDTDISDKENVIEGKIVSMYSGVSSVCLKIKDGSLLVYAKVSKHVAKKMELKVGCDVLVSLKKEAIRIGWMS